jgi:hypothetical protein
MRDPVAVTKPGRTAIAILADRSRSLRPVRAAAQAGLTGILIDQRETGSDVLVAIAPTGGELPPLRPVAEVTAASPRARGTAAVRDDLGELVTGLGTQLSAMPEEERPARVLVLVVAAGVEGARMSRDAIADVVGTQQRDYAWEFAYVGGEGADDLGIAPERALTCRLSDEGVRSGLAAASAFLSRARETQPWAPVEGFSDAERAAAAAPGEAEPAGWWQRLLGRQPELSHSTRP